MIWMSLLAFGVGANAADRYAGLCNVVFDCDSTLHAFSGDITNLSLHVLCETNVTGEAMFDTRLEVSPRQLTTHEVKRDANMYKMFQSDRFPQLVALVTNAPLASANLSPQGGPASSGTVPVQLTMCGITKEVLGRTSNARSCDNGWEFNLSTEISLKAFKLKPPSVLFGTISVGDTVKVKAHVKVQKEIPPL